MGTPLPWQANHSGLFTHQTNWMVLISVCPGKDHQAPLGLWGEQDTWVPESRGGVMGLTRMKAAIKSTMRQAPGQGSKQMTAAGR